MKTNTYILDVDIKEENYINSPQVRQNDDVEFVVNIGDSNIPFDLVGVTTVALAVERRDRVVVSYAGSITGVNQVTFKVPRAATGVVGRAKATIQLYGDNTRVSTISFSFDVQKDPTGKYDPIAGEKTLIEVVLASGPVIIQEAQDATVDVLAVKDALTTDVGAALVTLDADKTAAIDRIDQVKNENKTHYLNAVESVALRDSTYPNPVHGDTVRVTDTSTSYRFVDGTGWVITDVYNPTAIDNLNQQLADKANQVEVDEKLNDIGISQINKNKGKLDQTYISDELLAQIAGTAEINAVPADKSVTLQKTSFFNVKRINLIDTLAATDGRYLNATGVLATNGNFFTSDYIEVVAGSKYYTNGTGFGSYGFFYDEGEAQLTQVVRDGQGVFSVPSNAKYVRIPWQKVETPKVILSKSTEPVNYVSYDDFYVDIESHLKESIVKTASENLGNELSNFNGIIPPNATTLFEEKPLNMIDESTLLEGKYVNKSTGGLSSNSGYIATDFILVQSGVGYYGNHMNYNFAGFYDETKSHVGDLGVGGFNYFVPPSGVSYVRLTFEATMEGKKYLIEGTTPPQTIPNHTDKKLTIRTEGYRANLISELSRHELSGMKWNVLGDSITHAPGKTRNFHSIIASETGIYAKNYGVSGSRISLGAGGTVGNEMVTRYATMDDDADIVTVFGGINDMNNSLSLGTSSDRVKESFYGALHLLLSGLHKKYMGKRLGFISPINYGDATDEPYQQAIREVCKYYSIPLLDLSKDGLINTVVHEIKTNFITDGLHPDEAGHDVLARKIKQFLLTL